MQAKRLCDAKGFWLLYRRICSNFRNNFDGRVIVV